MSVDNEINLATIDHFNKIASIDVTSLVMSRYFINELILEIERKQKELDDRWKTLQRQCTHPTHKTTKEYSSGGYDYVSSVCITKTCSICDKVLESHDDPKHRGTHA